MEYFIESMVLGLTPTKDSCGYQLTFGNDWTGVINTTIWQIFTHVQRHLSNLFSISIEVPATSKTTTNKNCGRQKKFLLLVIPNPKDIIFSRFAPLPKAAIGSRKWILERWIKSYLSGHHATPIIISAVAVIFVFEDSFVRSEMEFYTCQHILKWLLYKFQHPHIKWNEQNTTFQCR